jgi:hypothetical protein
MSLDEYEGFSLRVFVDDKIKWLTRSESHASEKF